MKKTLVNYNGLPITLSKSYATKELKSSEHFIEVLTKKLHGGEIADQNINSVRSILQRRHDWVNALRTYLGIPKPE